MTRVELDRGGASVAAGDRGDRLIGLGRIEISHQHGRTGFGETETDRAPDAARATSHDGNAAFE